MKLDALALLARAKEARERAYAPYSRFLVGAALLCADGAVYTGCNVENASYTPTCCAERVALFKAVSEGKREFIALAVAGGKAGEDTVLCPPCGVCRQVMAELGGDTLQIVLEGADAPVIYRMEELLPLRFSL